MSDFEYEEEEFDAQLSGQTVKRIIGLVRPYWLWVVGFVSAIAVVAVAEGSFAYINKLIIDEAILANDMGRLVELISLYSLLMFVLAIGVFAFIYITALLGERVRYDLRKRLFDHLQTLSFSYFDRTPLGWIMSRVTSDTERIADLITWGFLDITWAVISLSTSIVFMMMINWKLALIMVVIFPVLFVIAVQFKKRIITQFRLVRKLNSKLTGVYAENITGVRVVKSLVQEERNAGEFDEMASNLYRAGYRAAWLSALFLPTVQLVSAVGLAAIVWYGGWQAQLGALTLGGIQAFVSYLAFMFEPIREVSRVFAEMQQSIASAERVFSLLDEEPEIVDRPYAVDPGTIRADIKFEDVNFWYEADKPVLQHFNLTIKQGETIALVGPTGAGKSTIINLICRFYEPSEGVIRIGGMDYTSLTQKAIQSRIGMVLQTPHLFSGTIKENLRFGRLDATDEDILTAAKIAYADEFIMNLDDGYETEVGEGGNLLSVGQKQLISLARAVLADPDLFIMDEATSSVDTMTEALIQQGMESLMDNRTSLVIAHRLSTIRRADRILVIENGGISEMGTHDALIQAKGHYYSLYTHQFRQELEQELAL